MSYTSLFMPLPSSISSACDNVLTLTILPNSSHLISFICSLSKHFLSAYYMSVGIQR